jgi:hypothetical protein
MQSAQGCKENRFDLLLCGLHGLGVPGFIGRGAVYPNL